MSDYKTIAELRTAVAEQAIRIALRAAYQAGGLPASETNLRRLASDLAAGIELETLKLAVSYGLSATSADAPPEDGRVLWGRLEERPNGEYRIVKLGDFASADATWGWRSTQIFVEAKTPDEIAVAAKPA
jgi:hypothetical protein